MEMFYFISLNDVGGSTIDTTNICEFLFFSHAEIDLSFSRDSNEEYYHMSVYVICISLVLPASAILQV